MTNSTDLKSRISTLLLEGSPTVLAANLETNTHELQKMPADKWESLHRSKKDQLKKIVSRRNEKVLSDISDDELSTILSKVDGSDSVETTDKEAVETTDKEAEAVETTDKEAEVVETPKVSEPTDKEAVEPTDKEAEVVETPKVSEPTDKEAEPTDKEAVEPTDKEAVETTDKEAEPTDKEAVEPTDKEAEVVETPKVSEPVVELIGIEEDDEESDTKRLPQTDGQTDLDLTPNFVNTFFSYVNSLMDKPVEVEKKEDVSSVQVEKSNDVVNATPDYSDPSVFNESKDGDKPLPEGWEKHISKTSNPGKEYYFNATTGETVWEHPLAVAESIPAGWEAHVSESSDPGKTYYHNTETGETMWEKPVDNKSAATEKKDESIPAGWEAHVSESSDPGKTYYHNAETGETVWEKPPATVLEVKPEPDGLTKEVIEGQCYKCASTQNLPLKTYKLGSNGVTPVYFCSFKCFEGIEF